MLDAKPARILHVDDNDANRYAVSRSLRRAGFDVLEAATGSDALRQVSAKPDLVILDVRLPDVSGFEVCRRIKSDPSTAMIPVLHLSASLVSSADKAFGLNGGADAYLVRPVEPVEIVATVNALLRARRSEEALRESEDRLRLAVEAGKLGTWDFRPATRELRCSDRSMEIFGFDPHTPISLTRFLEAVHPEDRNGLQRAVMASLDPSQTGEIDLDFRAVRPDGSTHWLVVKGRAVFETVDDQRTPIRITGTVLDITRDKLQQLEIERSRSAAETALAAAESANRVKDDFLATLGHELRTPLNAIIGWSQILQSGEHQPGDFAEGLATIQRNANLQAQLIEDLLDVSRIISGKLRLEMQPVDLRQVIDATIATVGPGADAKNITIEQSIDDSVTTIRGDPSRLQQVIWNLLSNAVKFTPPGGTVKLSLRPADGQIEIVIEDSGVGIAPEFLPHVFERFRQEDASTRRRQGGLGLGLAIVRQLVEIHNGSVQAFSDGPGKGSRFVVRLPHFQTPATEEPSKAPDEAARRAAADLNDVRVLLVDDEADSREMLKRALESLKAKVVATCSAADAMSALMGQPFDILVSDIGMPDEDGFDLIRQVRAADGAHRSIPAIALTAFARSEDRQRALGSGYQVHVAKPVDRLALAATIQRLLHDGAGEPRP